MGFFHCIYYLIHCSLNSNLLEIVIFFSPQWPCCVNPRVQSSFGVLLNPFLNNSRDLSYSHRHIYGKFLLLISFFFSFKQIIAELSLTEVKWRGIVKEQRKLCVLYISIPCLPVIFYFLSTIHRYRILAKGYQEPLGCSVWHITT